MESSCIALIINRRTFHIQRPKIDVTPRQFNNWQQAINSTVHAMMQTDTLCMHEKLKKSMSPIYQLCKYTSIITKNAKLMLIINFSIYWSQPYVSQMHTRSTNAITFRQLKLNVYISLASTPGPAQKIRKRARWHFKIPRMCWVSIMCKSHVLRTKGVTEYGNGSCQGATRRETRVVA